MKLKRLLPLSAAIGLAFLGNAQAQSLVELYDAARAYDATWQSAKSQYDASIARADQAKSGILPQVSLSGGASRNAITVDPVPQREYGTQSVTLSASQPLYRPANFATWEQAKYQAQQAEYALTAASQDLIVRVVQAYFDVLAAQDTLNYTRALKTATAEQLAAAKRNFEVGTTTITDTREAQARYDLVTAQEIQADNDLRVKKLALDTLVGRQGTNPNPLVTSLVVPSPSPADPDAWVSVSDTANPAILQARSNVDIAQLETQKAYAGHKPTLDLTGSLGETRNIAGTATTIADSRPKTGSVGVVFNLPLFSGFAVQNRVRETLALEDKARTDLEATRRTVAQQIRTAYFGVVSGQQQVKALESAEASSQSSLEANRLGYQVGVRINIDVLNAQTQLFQTKRDLAQARYNVLLGHLKLRQANGTLAAEDLDRLNLLLAP
ncbi:TolC family outer membrane protein [Ramlibacter sp. G-1-2-2]|uniref:TolC family outer membrane protein n=1 Tax=Ramlibacter agri TaxID=2728837 RepID=A0A848H4Z6_9BURK|nr:TolC family outer membrane protein [Ramlibacter agri]NML44872.1 TolC family outer membrane protein [Ramlibacter agri]